MARIDIVGGGLAGSEAALWLAARGYAVRLFEMRPQTQTPAHASGGLAELVCSNSLKSEQPDSAAFMLKSELLAASSQVLPLAYRCRVPAGASLAIDREQFSQAVTTAISEHPQIELRKEVAANLASLDGEAVIVATGPLTHPSLAADLAAHFGQEHLYFYDSIAPIVDVETIDHSIVFSASRYSKGDPDFLNVPLTHEEYERLIDAIIAAPKVPLHSFEEPRYYEGCLPVEVMVERGRDTLAYGPFKPVGLIDPRTGRAPYAVIQLRREKANAPLFNLVGFQTKMTVDGQRQVLQSLPGFSSAKFARWGSIHRNTFVNAPKVLASDLSLLGQPRIRLGGQLTGVEGYVESLATGLLAAVFTDIWLRGQSVVPLPEETMLGGLLGHLRTHRGPGKFQPMGAAFGLLPPVGGARAERGRRYVSRGADCLQVWLSTVDSQRLQKESQLIAPKS